MNDQQIYEFIALKQPVRAVQISDRFDVPLSEASDALKSLVEIGDVTRTAGTAPNLQPAQFYSLSPSFVKSREGQLVIARMEAAKAALEQAAAAPVAKVDPEPAAPVRQAVAAPAPATTVDIAINRTQVGIDHIRKVGSVSDSDLRTVMGLRAGQYPSAWLREAVKRGEINKDGKEWAVGPGSQIKRQPAFGGPLGLPGATPCAVSAKAVPEIVPGVLNVSGGPLQVLQTGKKAEKLPLEVPKFADLKPDETKSAAAESHACGGYVGKELEEAVEKVNAALGRTPAFRVGIWSDGALELQRNGVTVASLTQTEQEAVTAFIERIRQPEPA